MSETSKKTLSKDGQVMLESLQKAVTQTLEKKRQLGQYAVTWQDGKPLVSGEDAPRESDKSVSPTCRTNEFSP